MFHPDGRDGTAKYRGSSSSSSSEEKNFGWWLSHDRQIEMPSEPSEDHGSSDAFCVSADESGSYSFVRNVSRQEDEDEIGEKIELTSFAEDYLDVDLMDEGASEKDRSANDSIEVNDDEERKFGVVCYTPERLIRSKKYRILVPPPRYLVLSHAGFTPIRENVEQKLHRKRLSCLIDPKKIGSARLRELLDVPAIITDRGEHPISTYVPNHYNVTNDDSNAAAIKSDADSLNPDQDRYKVQSAGISRSSSTSSCDPLSSTWDDCKGPHSLASFITHPSSLEDTSGVHSSDWSMETPSDSTRIASPMSLCDELGIISRRATGFRNDRGAAINEVMSILEGLPSDAEKAMVLLEEEDRFYDSMSSHDQLTRLALSIETDTREETLAVPDDTINSIQHLRDKIERLQLRNKEIRKDICTLHTDFQCDEKKVTDLSNDTTEMLEELFDLRYLDDLLELLEGELEQISKRNWPFILGHSNPHEEINLII